MWMAVKRGIVVAIGLLIQILLTLFIYLKFGEFISIIQVVYGLLSIIIVLMIIKYSKRLSSDLIWILLIMLLISPFLMIAHLYFCVSVGSLVPNHKVLGAIGTYIVSYIVMQIFSTVVLGISGFAFSTGSMSTTGMTNAEATTFVTSMLNPIFTVSIIFELICLLLFFFVTKYIMTKKLNLE